MRLKDRVQILKPVYKDNGSGGQAVEYLEEGLLFANVKETAVSDANVRGKDTHIAKYEVVIRKTAIEADRRLIWEGAESGDRLRQHRSRRPSFLPDTLLPGGETCMSMKMDAFVTLEVQGIKEALAGIAKYDQKVQ
jgi:head-tail adaptor